MINRLCSLFLLLLVVLGIADTRAEENAKAEEAPAVADHIVDVAPGRLQRLEDYLNELTTLVADFVQIAPDGSLASGKFFLARPGRVRWQYDPPVPLLILVNDGMLMHYDLELEEVSHVPADETLAAFIAKDHVSLSEDVYVLDYREGAGTIRVTLAQKGKEDIGTLTLVFDDNPLQLRKTEVTNGVGETTTVSLNNPQEGVELDDQLFQPQNPRLFFKKKN